MVAARRDSAPTLTTARTVAAIPTRLVQPAYRALSKVLHPDAGGDLEAMKALTRAYQDRAGS